MLKVLSLLLLIQILGQTGYSVQLIFAINIYVKVFLILEAIKNTLGGVLYLKGEQNQLFITEYKPLNI